MNEKSLEVSSRLSRCAGAIRPIHHEVSAEIPVFLAPDCNDAAAQPVSVTLLHERSRRGESGL
jgi:hypothetical protein